MNCADDETIRWYFLTATLRTASADDRPAADLGEAAGSGRRRRGNWRATASVCRFFWTTAKVSATRPTDVAAGAAPAGPARRAAAAPAGTRPTRVARTVRHYRLATVPTRPACTVMNCAEVETVRWYFFTATLRTARADDRPAAVSASRWFWASTTRNWRATASVCRFYWTTAKLTATRPTASIASSMPNTRSRAGSECPRGRGALRPRSD